MIPPRELEEIRIRMMEELDLPNRQRCEMLEEELEKQRESFFEMRRQLEKMKFDNFQVCVHHHCSVLHLLLLQLKIPTC